MKVKIEISICTGLMLNDHSNPYIESTTVLSDNYTSCIIIIIMSRAAGRLATPSHARA